MVLLILCVFGGEGTFPQCRYCRLPSIPGRSVWQVGSLSHAINAEATGYLPLPDFPEEAPDPSVRDVEDNSAFWARRPGSGTSSKKTEEEGSDFYSSISGSEESGSETESETGEMDVCERESEKNKVCLCVCIPYV